MNKIVTSLVIALMFVGMLTSARASAPQMFGVNMPSGAFGSNVPGTYGYDYIYPGATDFDYYNGKGLTFIRVAFLWERIQHSVNATLDPTEMSRLDASIALAHARGMKVLLDMHNYEYYDGNIVGSAAVPVSAFQNVWGQLAAHYANETAIYGYDIMNEPKDTLSNWQTAAQAVVNTIRLNDTTHYVFIEGVNWSGSQTWATSNSTLSVTDSANLLVYSAHSYWNANHDGNYGVNEQGTASTGVNFAQPFVSWITSHGYNGHIGEYGVPPNGNNYLASWETALDGFLSYLRANNISGTYWDGGPWVADQINCEPTNNFTTDAIQMATLQNYRNVPNAGFEAPATSTYVYNPTGGSWTFTGNSGIQHNGSAWGAATAPDGTQTAFLQEINSVEGTISQAINFPATGMFTVSLQAAARAANNGGQPFNATIDGTVVATFTPTSTTSFALFTSNPFIISTTGNHTLAFVGTGTSGDKADFIDSVCINPASIITTTNVALASNGATASASSTYSNGFSPSSAIIGNRSGLNWGNGGGWNDATIGVYPDWLEVDFSGSKTISEIDVFTKQDGNPVTPTLTTTFTLDGITAFDVQYWNGSAWTDVPNGSVTGNNYVWRQFTFGAITTSKIRVVVNNSDGANGAYSRILDLEAWTTTNLALAANGATASASSTYSSGFSPSSAIIGNRSQLNWGNGGGWNDATIGVYPDWLEVDFSTSQAISEIDVFTKGDGTPVTPTLTTTFTLDGITAFDVQYWNGSAWVDVPNGSVTGNNNVWRQFTFSAITTSKIRVVVNNSDGATGAYSRILDLEAWGN